MCTITTAAIVTMMTVKVMMVMMRRARSRMKIHLVDFGYYLGHGSVTWMVVKRYAMDVAHRHVIVLVPVVHFVVFYDCLSLFV